MSDHESPRDVLRTTTLRFPAAQYDRLREIAQANHRTVSQEMRAIIAQHIADNADVQAAA